MVFGALAMALRIPFVFSVGALIFLVGFTSSETSVLVDELFQVSLLDQIFDLFLQIIAVFGLVPNVSVVGTVKAGVPFLPPAQDLRRDSIEVVLPHYS